MKTVCLLLLAFASGVTSYAQQATKMSYITVEAKAAEDVIAVVRKSGGKAYMVRNQGDVAVLRVGEDQMERISVFMHHAYRRCGGFVYHKTERAALDATISKANPPRFNRAVSYTLDNAAEVNALLPSVNETNIYNTIAHLSSYFNRYYTTQTGVDAANWIKSQWETIAGSRADVSVEFFNHSWAQPSVITTITGSTYPDEVIVLGGHLDSINGGASGLAPGADDDASGIAVVTEILRVLIANDFVPDRTVKFMAYAAEEVGLRGSNEIATQHFNDGINVVGVLQFDMTNYQGSAQDIFMITDNTNAGQNVFVENLIDTYLTDLTRSSAACGYACSDHASWHQQGFVASFPFEASFSQYNPSIHTANDTLAQSGDNAEHAEKFARLGVAYVAELVEGSFGICNPQAVADAGPNQTICLGSSVTLGTPAQAGHTYLWSPGGQTTAQINVSPSSTTTYTVTATTTCGSRSDSVDVIVDAGGAAGLNEDFESVTPGWSADGLWHKVTNSNCASPGSSSGSSAFYYGQDSGCTYNTGARTTGSLTSPLITGIDGNSSLSFDYYRVVESYSGAYDKCEVSVVTTSGSTVIWSRTTADASTASWQNSGALSLAAYAGQNIQIRFTFDSIDGVSNNFTGWLVDDVVVTGTSPCSNTAPSANITAPSDGASFNEGSNISFSGSAADAEDGNLSGSLSWSSNLDGALGSGASVNAVLSVGTHTVTASVTDSGGLSGSDSISVTVTANPTNTAPNVNITGPADGTTVNTGSALNFTASANDAEDGNLSGSVSWSSSLDGPLGNGASVNATLTVGVHTVTASVSDSGGLSDSDSISVTVNAVGGTWTQIGSYDFESGGQGWIDGGSDARRSANDSAYAHQGTYCWRLRDNSGASSSVTSPTLDLSGYSDIRVNFWYYPRSMENNEDFFVEISTNGATWTTIGNYAAPTDFTNNSFYNPEIIVNGAGLTANTRIRIRCDASGNSDYIYVDDVVISAK